MGKDLNRHFSKEDVQMANYHIKTCPISLIIRKIEMKITMIHNFIPIRKATVKN